MWLDASCRRNAYHVCTVTLARLSHRFLCCNSKTYLKFFLLVFKTVPSTSVACTNNRPGGFVKKSIIVGFMVIVAAVLGFYVGSPYLASNDLKNAAASGDSDQLDTVVDFPAVRESLKSQLNAAVMIKMQNDAEMQDNPFAGLATMMIPVMVEKAVDAFVTPDGIAAMVRGQKPDAKVSATMKPEAEYTTSYINLDRFKVTVKNAETSETGPALIFERRGLFAWKLVKIELSPNFMDQP